MADEKSVYKPSLGKGIIPHEAADFHQKNIGFIFNHTLKAVGLKMEDIDIVAYAAGAGLPPCLLVGANFAKKISKEFNKPLIPVCHQIAHLEIGLLKTDAKDPVFVYLSG
ncbi:MAG: UGMP family protein, partial [Candidatus Aenigmatarchaeota archaeon]